ncbi:DEAD/DEAH box helicase family protein [Bacillus cereus]|uniref:DEAD/DEAH box helicase family protein n=1 Tax=Bacillus cereus group TaxID=86661 RepID=UPI0018D16450|nr:DEAD/DEAH box helicase family protein [Bacillus cereus]MBH0318450.1 DEAD/DEAH box helicase family protein [Bacillus cereus]
MEWLNGNNKKTKGDNMSNFIFLKKEYPELTNIIMLAENYLYSDPKVALLKIKIAAEQLIDLVFVVLGKDSEGNLKLSQYQKLELLKKSKVNPAIINVFDYIRRVGNMALHEDYSPIKAAERSLESLYHITCWFYSQITGGCESFPNVFSISTNNLTVVNEKEGSRREIERLKNSFQEEAKRLKKHLDQWKRNGKTFEGIEKIAINNLELTEADTRKKLIDVMLEEAGWKVNDEESVKLEYEVEGYPSKSGKGLVDYVLFDKKGNPIALIEAKKTSRGAEDGRIQARLYADCIQRMHGTRPVIFYTNGFESWIWDDLVDRPREVWGMYALNELEFIVIQRNYKKSLVTTKLDYNIAGRPYQIEGIKRVYEKYELGKRRSLMVMATGSGKTRTAIALVKGMIESKWAKRILFLADRDELVDQAMQGPSSFKTFLPEATRMRVSSKTYGDSSKSLYFSTYSAMKNYYSQFNVGFFDLIIVDESHRSIYKSYREIIEYFDAYLLALTATPINFIERSTFNLFDCENGDPTFLFSYEEACEHNPPFLLEYKVKNATTQFMRGGIKWNNLNEEQKRSLIEAGYSESNIDFDKETLDKFVANKETTQFILRSLMNEGIKVGDTIGKSIIFARNIEHAKRLVKEFDAMYPQYKGELATIIHSGLGKIQSKAILDEFRFKDRPRIAISVDMLDTGIDIPGIVNLVFAKPIYSKTKFLQMIGRGTRLCKNLFGAERDKEYFLIIDHWNNFEFFDMNPEGYINHASKVPLQIRFDLRVTLLEILINQNFKKQAREMIDFIREDIANLPEKSIEIKKKRKNLEKLKEDSIWNVVNSKLIDILRKEVAPLMQWIDTQSQQDTIWFDNEVYRIQIEKLNKDYPRALSRVDKLIGEFSRLRIELNQFEGKREYISSWMHNEKWITSQYDEIEESRKNLRSLMKYRGKGVSRGVVELNISDTDSVIQDVKDPFVSDIYDVDNYRIRVKEALEKEFEMQPFIKKIREGILLKEDDFKKIHEVFESRKLEFNLFELSERVKVSIEDIQGLLRKFVGVDVEEINERFQSFVQKNHDKMSATQIQVLDMIKRDIIKNRGISFAALYESPYTSISSDGVDGVFNEIMTDEIFALIEPYKIKIGESYA